MQILPRVLKWQINPKFKWRAFFKHKSLTMLDDFLIVYYQLLTMVGDFLKLHLWQQVFNNDSSYYKILITHEKRLLMGNILESTD